MFIKKYDNTKLNFKNMSLSEIIKYLENPIIKLIWNGRKFKKLIIQWKSLKNLKTIDNCQNVEYGKSPCVTNESIEWMFNELQK